MQARPVLVLSPRDDASFSSFALAQLTAGPATPQEFQAALRTRYPRTVVRQRELSDEGFTMWYVYRDGRWVGRSRDE